MSTLAATIGRGVTGSRPAASEAGRLYYDTTAQIWYRDNGSSWDASTPSSLSNPMTTSQDIIVGGASGTPGRLAIGATDGMALRRVSGNVAWQLPPGHELDYVQITSNQNITATSEGASDTVLTGTSQAYDGTAVELEFFCPRVTLNAAATNGMIILLYDGGTVVGRLATIIATASVGHTIPVIGKRRFTPTAATHQYIVKAYNLAAGTGTIVAGAGGTGVEFASYLRITKA